MPLLVKNSTVDTLVNADTLDVIVKTSVMGCNSVNTLSPTFITSTGNNNISEDGTASTLGIGVQDTNINSYFIDPANGDYRIDETNTAAMTALQGTGWNGSDIVSWAWATSAVAISVALSGTATPTSTEVDIVSGGKTLIITLTGDTWLAYGIDFDGQRQSIINGLGSAQSEILGFNNEVVANELVSSVVRDSDTQITITLSAAISYDITTTETITHTIPASALITSTVDVVADSTFAITATAGGFKIVWASGSNQLIGAM